MNSLIQLPARSAADRSLRGLGREVRSLERGPRRLTEVISLIGRRGRDTALIWKYQRVPVRSRSALLLPKYGRLQSLQADKNAQVSFFVKTFKTNKMGIFKTKL